jgi:hypothetical protein
MNASTVHAATQSRWFDWKPKAPKFEEFTGTEPTKPSKPSSVGFVGATTASKEIWISRHEWKARALNSLFQEQGLTRKPGKITAATVQHGEAGGLTP